MDYVVVAVWHVVASRINEPITRLYFQPSTVILSRLSKVIDKFTLWDVFRMYWYVNAKFSTIFYNLLCDAKY
jgi:hypothetical protein